MEDVRVCNSCLRELPIEEFEVHMSSTVEEVCYKKTCNKCESEYEDYYASLCDGLTFTTV